MNIFRINRTTEVASDCYLLVGLGNPGREYANTRHNVGFMVISALGKEWNININRMQQRALTGDGIINGKKIILAKPQTFMNLSGQSVGSLVRYFKIPLDHMMVFHDDLDLPLGTIRIRPQGGSAGQKGIASIIETLSTPEFPRMRIGIGRPPGQMDAADYVLQLFPFDSESLLKIVFKNSVDAVKTYLDEGLEAAMTRFNGN